MLNNCNTKSLDLKNDKNNLNNEVDNININKMNLGKSIKDVKSISVEKKVTG